MMIPSGMGLIIEPRYHSCMPLSLHVKLLSETELERGVLLVSHLNSQRFFLTRNAYMAGFNEEQGNRDPC
eukprot:c5141_g1_i1 orf=126-335(+)